MGAFYVVAQRRLSSSKTASFVTADSVRNYLSYIRVVLDAVSDPYLLIIEDDVRLTRPINQTQLRHAINGANVHVRLHKRLLTYIAHKRGESDDSAFQHYYGGCGGNILDVAFWRRALDALSDADVTKILRRKAFLSHAADQLGIDEFISTVALAFNGTVEPIADFYDIADPGHQPKIEEAAIYHQYKDEYAVDTSPAEVQRIGGVRNAPSFTRCSFTPGGLGAWWSVGPSDTPATVVTAVTSTATLTTTITAADATTAAGGGGGGGAAGPRPLADQLGALADTLRLNAPFVVFADPSVAKNVTALLIAEGRLQPGKVIELAPPPPPPLPGKTGAGAGAAGAGAGAPGRLELLRRVAESDPFGSTLFFWMDADTGRLFGTGGEGQGVGKETGKGNGKGKGQGGGGGGGLDPARPWPCPASQVPRDGSVLVQGRSDLAAYLRDMPPAEAARDTGGAAVSLALFGGPAARVAEVAQYVAQAMGGGNGGGNGTGMAAGGPVPAGEQQAIALLLQQRPGLFRALVGARGGEDGEALPLLRVLGECAQREHELSWVDDSRSSAVLKRLKRISWMRRDSGIGGGMLGRRRGLLGSEGSGRH